MGINFELGSAIQTIDDLTITNDISAIGEQLNANYRLAIRFTMEAMATATKRQSARSLALRTPQNSLNTKAPFTSSLLMGKESIEETADWAGQNSWNLMTGFQNARKILAHQIEIDFENAPESLNDDIKDIFSIVSETLDENAYYDAIQGLDSQAQDKYMAFVKEEAKRLLQEASL